MSSLLMLREEGITRLKNKGAIIILKHNMNNFLKHPMEANVIWFSSRTCQQHPKGIFEGTMSLQKFHQGC
jgi:hypothetical protein